MSVSSQTLTEIAPESASAIVLPKDARLLVVDPCGGQVADLVSFRLDDVMESLSNGRTFDYNSSLRVGLGTVLYSNRSNPMLTVTRDDVGQHDFLLTPCSKDTWRLCYDDPSDHRPGCHGNLARVLAPFGISNDMIPTTLNIFMNVEITDGVIAVKPPLSRPGAMFELRADQDLVIGLTACSALLSNNYRLKPIQYAVA